jgi:hypothetical protein
MTHQVNRRNQHTRGRFHNLPARGEKETALHLGQAGSRPAMTRNKVDPTGIGC